MSLYSLCNWRAAFSPVAVCCALTFLVGLPVAAQVHLTDEATGITNQLYGAAICALDDLDGDGMDEFLVGAPGHVSENGSVFLWRSRDGGTAHGVSQTWMGNTDERFGWAVARIGDVNNDGEPDFAVGAPLANAGAAGNGRVCIFYGGSTLSSSPDRIITGETAGDQFGFSISAAGDFNGDGRDDFIVGAPYRNSPSMEGGAAYVIYGASGGPSTDLGDALYLTGEVAGDHFGWAVTQVGTFFDGNEDCVAVGAPDNDSHFGADAGVVYVFEGDLPPGGPNATYDLLANVGGTSKPGSRYGFALKGGGDFNGDNTPDLAIGAPMNNEGGTESGRVEVIFGDSNPSLTGDRYANGETGYDHFGYAVGQIWEGSGFTHDSLIIGAPHQSSDGANSGRAYIYVGGSGSYQDAGSLTVIDVTPLLPGNQGGDEFGLAVCGAGDFDGDGIFDFAVGAPNGNSATTTPSGYVYLGLTSGNAVSSYLSGWTSVWQDDATVQLTFNLAPVGTGVASVEIIRDADGRQTVWDGAPVTADLTEPGRLVAVGRSFSFIDSPDPRSAPTYSLKVRTTDGGEVTLVDLAGPGDFTGPLPAVRLALDAPWPNPFNPTTRIRFRVPAGQAAACLITDLRGRQVRTLFSGEGDGTWRTEIWNGRTDDGRPVASGVYLVRLTGGGEVRGGRVVLAK